MSFETMNDFVRLHLAEETATFFNLRADSFCEYFGPNDYFNEDTVKSAMARLLGQWIDLYDEGETAIVFMELFYTGFSNRADIAVVYLTENGQPIRTKTLYIELKTDFDAESVNGDIHLLDSIAGTVESPITRAYAFFTFFAGEDGWTRYIEPPTQGNVGVRGIQVISP